jgi:hypothetical protein
MSAFVERRFSRVVVAVVGGGELAGGGGGPRTWSIVFDKS